jgi:formyltetrahydrofolate deformylase
MPVVPPSAQYVLTLSCPNKPGIVAGVSAYLFGESCNILDAQQYDDTQSTVFFMRVVFNLVGDTPFERISSGFADLAKTFNMNWTMRAVTQKKRVMVLVSKFDHCLADLLYRWRIDELPMELTAIVANHPRDLVVLARYMQILSEGLSAKLSGRCINIHHSFLPGFKGANPYKQAHTRGVKLIGATAHYVTSDLDEGPIIEQDVERISHRDLPEDLVRKGRDIERRVLARAVRHHLEDRVILNGTKTVVFGD